MAQKQSSVFSNKGKSKGKSLFAVIVVATLAATLAIIVTSSKQSSTAGFEHSLSVNALELNEADLNRALDIAKDAGANSTSYGAIWPSLNQERSPRSYDWAYLDRLVEAAEARGMSLRLQLWGTPDWVHPNLKSTVPNYEDRTWHPPRSSTELEHWGDFVYDVVSRYKGRVSSYEIWNEPNIEDFWKPEPDPAEYAALLRTAYRNAKSAYPGAVVEFGGINRNDIGFLEAYYSEAEKYPDAASKKYFFDILNVHPYSSIFTSAPGEKEEPISPDRYTAKAISEGYWGKVDKNFLGLKHIKAAMDAQGDNGKSIFIGEYGFSTSQTWMKAVPHWTRALYLKRAYLLARQLPYVKGISWYHYHPGSHDDPEWTIVDADWKPSMSYRALKQVTGAESGGATVTLIAPNTSVSGTYPVSPAVTNLDLPSYWELYVDGEQQGTTYTQVPIDWDTTKVADGKHTLMVAAYPQEGSQAGSVWPSEPVSVTVNNAGSEGFAWPVP